jgi:hypothetical protein
VCACVRVRACACVALYVGVGAGVCLRACRLITHYATRRRHIVCVLSGFTIFFRYCLINGAIFGKKVTENKTCVWFSLQLLFETFLILRRNQQDVVIDVNTSSA